MTHSTRENIRYLLVCEDCKTMSIRKTQEAKCPADGGDMVKSGHIEINETEDGRYID